MIVMTEILSPSRMGLHSPTASPRVFKSRTLSNCIQQLDCKSVIVGEHVSQSLIPSLFEVGFIRFKFALNSGFHHCYLVSLVISFFGNLVRPRARICI